MSGCGGPAQPKPAREYLMSSKSLNDAEKAYALRVFDWGASKAAWKEKAQKEQIDPNFYRSAIYKKYGLGERTELTPEEKIYILRIPSLITALQYYNSINLGKVSENEIMFVKHIHEKYGEGPFDWRATVMQENEGKITESQEDFFSMIEVVSNHKAFTDQDLIFWYRSMPH
jgi:hypothetical protein